MSIISVAHTKGGVGKTSIALSVAIYFSTNGNDRRAADVLLVDADPQDTATDFTALRTEQIGDPGYTCCQLRDRAVRDQIRKLAPKHDMVVIDVGGRDTEALRAALLVSSIVLIPVAPGSFDLWSTDKMAQLVRDARNINEHLDAVAFVNMADAQGGDNAAIAEALRETEGIRYIDAPLVKRKAWRTAQAEGRAIWEVRRPDDKANSEFTRLLYQSGVEF